jgi:dienelactone hydrolase
MAGLVVGAALASASASAQSTAQVPWRPGDAASFQTGAKEENRATAAQGSLPVTTQAWLAMQPWAEGRRVAVMGMSNGGRTVLAALRTTLSHPEPFVAGSALYPGCQVVAFLVTHGLISGDAAR